MELFQWRSSKAGQARLLNPASKAEVEEELATPIPGKTAARTSSEES